MNLTRYKNTQGLRPKGHYRYCKSNDTELDGGGSTDLGGKAVTQDQEYDGSLEPFMPWRVTALQLTLLQSRIKTFLTGQPKAMASPRVKRFSEIPHLGTSNKAENEESS